MRSRAGTLRITMLLLAVCSLQAARVTRTYAIENRSDGAWILLDPTPSPSAADHEIQATGDGPGPAPWTDRSSPSTGFCGIIEAHSTITLNITAEEPAEPPVLHLFRASRFTMDPIRLDLASSRLVEKEDGEQPDGRFIITPDERLAAPAEASSAPPSSSGSTAAPVGPAGKGGTFPVPASGTPPGQPAMKGGTGCLLCPRCAIEDPHGAGERSAPTPSIGRLGISPGWMLAYCSEDLMTILAPGFPEAVLRALEEPLRELASLRKVCATQFAVQQALLAQAQAIVPTESPENTRRLAVIRGLLEASESKALVAFTLQAGRVLCRAQSGVLQALAASHHRLGSLSEAHAQSRAEALAAAHRLMEGQWRVLGCLSLEWDGLAYLAPWTEWRTALQVPRPGPGANLYTGWVLAGEASVPPFLDDYGTDRIRFVNAEIRAGRMAEKSGVDLMKLKGFDLEVWCAEQGKRRTGAEAGQKAQEEKRALERMVQEREKADRAQAHQKREAERQAFKMAQQQCEQEAKRAASARARQQRKRDWEFQTAEKRRLAEAARIQVELEQRQRTVPARLAEAVLTAEVARNSEAARQAAQAREAKQAGRAAEKAKRAAEAEAEAKRVAEAEANVLAQAEAERAAQARLAMERAQRVYRLLLIPRGAPIGSELARRVQAALDRYRIQHPQGLPPKPGPPAHEPASRMINPLRQAPPARPPETLRRYATRPYPTSASAP